MEVHAHGGGLVQRHYEVEPGRVSVFHERLECLQVRQLQPHEHTLQLLRRRLYGAQDVRARKGAAGRQQPRRLLERQRRLLARVAQRVLGETERVRAARELRAEERGGGAHVNQVREADGLGEAAVHVIRLRREVDALHRCSEVGGQIPRAGPVAGPELDGLDAHRRLGEGEKHHGAVFARLLRVC